MPKTSIAPWQVTSPTAKVDASHAFRWKSVLINVFFCNFDCAVYLPYVECLAVVAGRRSDARCQKERITVSPELFKIASPIGQPFRL